MLTKFPLISKTEVLLFRNIHKTINHSVGLKLNGKNFSFSRSVKYLGVHLDDLLSWNSHFAELSIKLRKANGLISKLRHFAPKSILLQFYNSFFESHLRYACQIWAQNSNSCTRIFKLQKQCVRLLTFSNFNASSSPIFLDLKILKLPDLVKRLNIISIYNVLAKSLPPALNNIYNLKKYPDFHNTRGNALGLLTRPLSRTMKYGVCSIIYQSVVQWNEFQLLYPGSDLSTLSISELSSTKASFLTYTS